MTEAEWLTATDPAPMLAFLRGRASERKLRLFWVACAGSVWANIPGEVREGVHTAERHADRLASQDALVAATVEVHSFPPRCRRSTGLDWFRSTAPEVVVAYWAALTSTLVWSRLSLGAVGIGPQQALRSAGPHYPDLLREVFGNPFHPVTVNPSWVTPDVLALARGMYDSRDFSEAPALADALAAAGCADAAVLGHLRCGGVHVRGCWVVDAVLGLE
jgi:hypothetical protein